MTANVCRGRVDGAAFDRILNETSADVVAVQEVGPVQASVLERRFGFGRVRPSSDGEGNALVAHLPMTVDTMALPGRPALHGEVRTPHGPLSVVAVHLLNPLDAWLGRGPFRGPQVAALCDRIDAYPSARILVGDLNADERWPAYRKLIRRFDDAVDDFSRREGCPAPRTWSRGGRGVARLRIDHVLASGWRATNVEVTELPGSDHRAVVVDLLPEPQFSVQEHPDERSDGVQRETPDGARGQH